MKYSCEVIINMKRDEVIKLFDDMDNLNKWQKGLKKFEIIEGEKGVDGLKSRLTYEMNGSDVTMIETIEKFDFPNEMIAIYEADKVWNRCDNHFEDLGDKTKWVMETELKCKGSMRLATMFGKKQFMKQTQSDMESFKTFAESLKES